MLLGAARLLKENEDQLQGTVKLMFQPGEEMGYGAKLMLDDGLLEEPAVDAAFALHVDPSLPVGRSNVKTGCYTSSMDTYFIRIQGKGGHSSQPQRTVDPVAVANHLYQGLNLMVARESDPAGFTTFSMSVMQAGTVTNVIPATAEVQCNLRSQDPATRERLLERIPEMIDHVVRAWRADYEVDDFHTPSVINDEALLEQIRPTLERLLGAENLQVGLALSGSEDFSHISFAVPSMYVFIGAGQEGWDFVHVPTMRVDERVLPLGAAVHAAVATDWLAAQSG